MTTDPADPAVARPRSPWRRRIAIGLGVCVLLLVAAIVAIHLPVVRSAVLTRVIAALEGQGITLTAGRLHYNLATLTVTLDDVTVAATGVEPAFLHLERARVDLPWAAITGAFRADSVEVANARVTLVRDANGQLNLPGSTSDPDAEPFEGPVVIDRLLAGPIAVSYEDATSNQRFEARGIALDMTSRTLTPLAGTLSMTEAATLQVGDRSTTITRLAGQLTFDGVRLGFDPIELEAPELSLRADGSVDAFGSDPTLDVRYTLRVDAERSAAWTTVDPAPTGVIALTGTAEGERDTPDVTVTVATETLAWSPLGPLALDGQAAFSTEDSEATIERLRVAVAGGELTGAGRVGLEDDATSQVEAKWTNLDLPRLLEIVPDLAVRPGAVSSGTLALAWTGTDVLAGNATITTAQRALGARPGILPVAGRIDLSTTNRQWRLSGTPQVAGSIDARIQATGRLTEDMNLEASPLGGTATIAIADLADALEQLELTDLVPDLGDRESAGGAVTVDLTLAGTLAQPRATGTLDGQELRISGTGPATLAARFDASPRVVDVADLRVDLGPNSLTGQASIGIAANTLMGEVRADLPDLTSVAAAVPEAWRPTGAASMTATLSGALDNPTADVKLTSSTIEVAGQTIDTIESQIQVANRVARVDSLVLTQQDGKLSVTGQYAVDEGRYTFAATGTDIVVNPIVTADASSAAVPPAAVQPSSPAAAQPAAVPPSTLAAAPPAAVQPSSPAAAQPAAPAAVQSAAVQPSPEPPAAVQPSTIPIRTRFDLDLKGEGTIDAPQAAGQLRFAHIDWGAYQVGEAVADVALADGRAEVAATVPSVSGNINATVELESRRLSATATLDNAELAALARATGPASPDVPEDDDDFSEFEPEAATRTIPLTGTIRLDAKAEGSLDDLAAMDVTAEFALNDATVNGVPVRVERTARVHHVDGAVEAEDLEMYIGDARLTARGRLGAGSTATDGMTVELVGTLADFAPLARMAPGLDEAEMAGNLELNVRAFGPLDTPDIAGYLTLTNGSVATPDIPAATDVTLAATYSAGMVNVSTMYAKWQGADLLAIGHAPVSLMDDAIPAAYRATLPPVLGPARFDVRIQNLSPEALRPFLDDESVAQIAGQVDLSADVEATGLDLDQVTAEVRLDRAEVELARVPLAQTQPTRLRLANRRLDVVEWNWAGTGNEFAVRGHVQLDEGATALDLGVTGSLDLRMISAFAPGMATSGRANIDIAARGEAGAPDIDGTVALEDTNVVVRDPRVAITDLEGVARLSRNRITLEGLTANANGGTISIIGGLDYSEFAVREGAITITGRSLAIEPVEGLRTELNTDLTISMVGGDPAIGGRVTIVRGDYRQPLRLTEQLFSTLEMRTSGPGATNDGMMSRMQLDITVVSAEDLAVNNNYGSLEVATNLRVTGTPASPVLGGRLALREGGEIYLGGQTYTLQRGTIDFTNATRIEPNFDIALETRVRSNDITLEISGTPETLEVDLRSPDVPQQDAISLLLTGQTADESTMAYTDIARGQLLMLLSGELLSTAGRAVGLDSVQISRGLGGAASTFDLLATESDPGARLTLAKNLSRELELIMSQSLRNTGDITWIAVYRPVRRIELRAATDDRSRETYEFRHEIQFGGAATATSGPPPRPPDPRISAVLIEGEPGFPNAELMNQMRLGVGDRFDYFNWQRDRDRLAEYYHSRGFREARISARRATSGGGQMALTYNISQGPRTTLQVEGFTLSRAATAEIEDAWSQSVFDGFLEDDAERIAQRALVQARHLQGTVDATVSTDADGNNKTLTVSIAPGPQSTTRRIDFTGNEAIPSGELESAIETRNGTLAVWLEPNAIENTLEALYRSRGHLTAEVSVSAPRFENGTAVLPVRIDEGPAYRVGMIGVSGAAYRTGDAVREVTELKSGTPYLPGEIEPARRRVEVDYLGAGYNDVSVSTIVGIDEERAVVDVVFAVAEGPQQILQDVTVSGSRVTSDGTIDRALRLDMGQPLDMSDVYSAQKRLYDTSVFQRVDMEVEPIEGADAAPGTQPVRAIVGLQELPRFRFRYGFRVSDSPGPAEDSHQIRPALVADFLNRNVFGRAIAAGVAGQLEADRYLARGILSLPTPFRLPLTTNVFLTWSREIEGDEDAGILPYIVEGHELTFEQRMRPARTMSVSWGYTYSRDHTFFQDPDPNSPPLDDLTYVARLTSTYSWDTRDDPSNATRGWFHSSGLEYAPGRFGSSLKFVRYLAQQYYFRRAGEHVVLASALRVGLGRGFGQDLIREERFFTGGGTSVRGFGEEAIGGRNFVGLPIGGAGLFQFNQEVRFPIFRWVRGVGFFDAGNVFRFARDMRLTDLERGAGLGLRIQSPFAVIRVDYGVPLSNRQNERPRWYFGIGQTF